MRTVDIEVNVAAFESAVPVAFDEWKAEAGAYIEHLGDQVVDRAKELAPKRTGRLAASIRRDPFVLGGRGGYVIVRAGGPGIRETIFMEFGTYKDRPHPYMRPALASIASGLRTAGVAARLSSSTNARSAVKRRVARERVRKLLRRGQISARTARETSRAISSQMRVRAPRRRGR